jgi:aspartate dehydrogenase
MPRIGILGCGNIANILATHATPGIDIRACHDVLAERTAAYARKTGATACADLDTLLRGDYPVLVEAASIEAVRSTLPSALLHGKDVLVLSVGALADSTFRESIRHQAADLGRRIYVPSGALFGLDNLKVSRLSPLESLVLRSTKPPAALDMPETTGRYRVFRGDVAEAVRRYPRNINVAAALALASGCEPVVEIWVDPDCTGNRHEIEAQGDFGRVSIRTDNRPSPDNPRTSYLAALSALSLLTTLDEPIQVGT